MRIFARHRRHGVGWPTSPPPTVPPDGPPVFPCPECRQPLPEGRAACDRCGAGGPDGEDG